MKDSDRANLTECLALLAEECDICSGYIKQGLIHLARCEDPAHRREVSTTTAANVSSMMTIMRMVGWVEEKLNGGLVNPAETLAALKADKAARAIAAAKEAAANDPTPAPSVESVSPPTPADAASAAMDKLSNVYTFPTTKQ